MGQLVNLRLDVAGHVTAFETATTHVPDDGIWDFEWYALDGTLLSAFSLPYAAWNGHICWGLQLDVAGHVVAFCMQYLKDVVFYWYLLDGNYATGGTPSGDIWDLRLDVCGHVKQFAIDVGGNKTWFKLNGEAA